MKGRLKTTLLLVLVAAGVTQAKAEDWGGFYAGLNAGYGWGTGKTTTNAFIGPYHPSLVGALPVSAAMSQAFPGNIDTDPKGFTLGGQIGYNWVRSSVLYGVELDLRGAWMKGSADAIGVAPVVGFPVNSLFCGSSKTDELSYLSTLRGRIGYAGDRWLVYGTGGLALGHVKTTLTSTEVLTGSVGSVTTAMPSSVSGSSNRLGWTVGVGAEYALSDKWSLKGEYLYYDLGSTDVQSQFTSYQLGTGAVFASANAKTSTKWTGNLLQIGVNYRFGRTKAVPPPPPVVEEEKPAPPPPPPPPPPPVEEKPVVVAPPPPTKIVLDQAVLHFANNKAVMSAEGVEAVQKVAEELKQYTGNYTLVVTGYTSSIGSKAWNKTLSKRRADAVAKVLEDSGIPVSAVQTVGMGPENPIADNKTAEGQAKNRRVEIEVKAEDGSIEKRTILTQTQDTPKVTPKKKKVVVKP
jgi:outer membrane immunogenic protein